MRREALPVAWCLAAAALFGASAPAAKVLIGSLGPLTLAGLLYLGAALFVLPAAEPHRVVLRRTRGLGRLAVAVVLGGAVAPVLLMLALARAPAASVSVWLGLESIATSLLAWAFFHEDMRPRIWAAAGLATVASGLLAAPSGWEAGLAAGLVALAAICWALDNNLTATIDTLTPSQITFTKGLVGGGLNLTLGLALEGLPARPVEVLPALVVGALGYGASLVLYIRGAQRLGAARSQLVFASAPFFGMVIAWSLFGEPVLPAQGVACALMLLGVALSLGGHHAHGHAHAPVTHEHAHRHDDGHHGHPHEGLSLEVEHTHEHAHAAVEHDHPHAPDLHHRHPHAD